MKLVASALPERRTSTPMINNAMAQAAIWQFFRSDPDRVVLKVGGFFKIRVRDLKPLFELLAGPEPADSTFASSANPR